MSRVSSGFTEVSDRVWVARYEWYDVNVSVIEGSTGLVVVDTHASAVAARGVIEDLRRLSSRPVVGIVNTHAHFDHVLGNHAFRSEYGEVPITAHEATQAVLQAEGSVIRDEAAARDGSRGAEIAATEVVVPDHSFSSVRTIDIGDRAVELVHPGRGHTDGDVVVRLTPLSDGGADVLLAGDLVEESGPPAWGSDCYPMEWPLSLDLVMQLIGPATVVVPGHGAPVDRDFVEEQRAAIGVVAETIRDLAGRGVAVGEALEAAQWPYPAEVLGQAVARGYQQLPRASKRLPLV